MFHCIWNDLHFALFSKWSQYVKGHCAGGETKQKKLLYVLFKTQKEHFLNPILNSGKKPKPNQTTNPTPELFEKFNIIHLNSELLKFNEREEPHSSMATKLLPKVR